MPALGQHMPGDFQFGSMSGDFQFGSLPGDIRFDIIDARRHPIWHQVHVALIEEKILETAIRGNAQGEDLREKQIPELAAWAMMSKDKICKEGDRHCRRISLKETPIQATQVAQRDSDCRKRVP